MDGVMMTLALRPHATHVPCTIQHSKAAIHYRVKEAKEQQHAYIREG